jgi:hypothetical protein
MVYPYNQGYQQQPTIWVAGIEEAQTYPVALGTTVKLWDRNRQTIRSMRYSRRRPAYDDGMGGISESAYRGSSYRYSRHGGGQDELQSALQEIRDPNTRMKIQKLIEEME